jgi:hypothetical protein
MHIFEVPQLLIDHNTEAIFRNLMALEQCHYPSNTYICSFVLLWDCLIETEKDADLLVDNKVIANHLGSNAEMATLINKLGYQIVVAEPSYFPSNHFLATLKESISPIFSEAQQLLLDLSSWVSLSGISLGLLSWRIEVSVV